MLKSKKYFRMLSVVLIAVFAIGTANSLVRPVSNMEASLGRTHKRIIITQPRRWPKGCIPRPEPVVPIYYM